MDIHPDRRNGQPITEASNSPIGRGWLRCRSRRDSVAGPAEPGVRRNRGDGRGAGRLARRLGRSLCSLLARSFVCECHTISAVPRFQPPPRRTQHADFPHCALLFASPQGLWGLRSK